MLNATVETANVSSSFMPAEFSSHYQPSGINNPAATRSLRTRSASSDNGFNGAGNNHSFTREGMNVRPSGGMHQGQNNTNSSQFGTSCRNTNINEPPPNRMQYNAFNRMGGGPSKPVNRFMRKPNGNFEPNGVQESVLGQSFPPSNVGDAQNNGPSRTANNFQPRSSQMSPSAAPFRPIGMGTYETRRGGGGDNQYADHPNGTQMGYNNQHQQQQQFQSNRNTHLEGHQRSYAPSYHNENTDWQDSRQNGYGPRSQYPHEFGAGADLKPVDWIAQSLPPVVWAPYFEHPDVASMGPHDVLELFKQMEVSVTQKGMTPNALPKPIMNFHLAPFSAAVMEEFINSGYQEPYPIQSIGWAVCLSNQDMVGIAQTGSGKTLAYLLPCFNHIDAQSPVRPGDGPLGLILAPTRELAKQIEKEAVRFSRAARRRVACVYGGVPRGYQSDILKQGVHLIIATPGRLLDFLSANVTNVTRVSYLVLDEADRMLDMGFEPQIRRIISQIRPERQTLMWSATWPREVQQLARDLCKTDPIKITVGSHDLQANANISQIVEICDAPKLHVLAQIITDANASENRTDKSKVLVFCETKRGCDELRDELRMMIRSLRTATIHGNKEQRERDRTIADFKAGRFDVLIATDVASRGLDIKNIDLVVNYDVPKTIEDYIHRIGRTGRAGDKGVAITLFAAANSGVPEQCRMAREICGVIRDAGFTPSPELIQFSGGRVRKGGNDFGARRGGYPRERGGRGSRGFRKN